jgi:PIN domain nuclease of toxin-antitoxin system
MAAATQNPKHKQSLFEMAEAWEMLARVRTKQIEKQLTVNAWLEQRRSQ